METFYRWGGRIESGRILNPECGVRNRIRNMPLASIPTNVRHCAPRRRENRRLVGTAHSVFRTSHSELNFLTFRLDFPPTGVVPCVYSGSRWPRRHAVMSRKPQLALLQLAIMRILWQREEATVGDVR